ncbi:MAG: hypothetical protein ACWGON_10620 [Gemmatimonadota bacterium]
MRANRLFALVALAVLSGVGSANAQRFPGSEDLSHSGFGVGLTAGYTFLGGAVGDSVSGGPRLEGIAFYDFGDTPVQVGAGASFAWLGFDSADGSLDMPVLFGFGTWRFVDLESSMIPFVSLRLGWTELSDDQPCGFPYCLTVEGEPGVVGTRTRSGFDVGAGVGVDIPLSSRFSAEIGGNFDWLFLGDYQIDGERVDTNEPVSFTLPDSSRQGSAFTLFAGLQYYFSP